MDSKIALHGWVYSRNYGDMLMLDLARHWLREVSSQEVSLPWAVRSVLEDLGLPGTRDRRQFAATIVPGGGSFGLPPNAGIRQELSMVKKFELPLLSSAWSGHPYYLIGVGAGPFGSSIHGQLVRHVFSGAAKVTVRDEESAEYLSRAGVSSGAIEVTSDLVLAMDREDIPADARAAANDIFKSIGGDGPVVGVHFAEGPKHDGYAASHEAIAILARQRPDWRFALLIDHPSNVAGQLIGQMQAAQHLLEVLGNRAQVINYPGHWVLAALIGMLDAVITNKLHVAVTGLVLGKPAIAVAKHSKNARLFRQLGVLDWCFDLKSADSAVVADRLDGLVSGGTVFTVPEHVRSLAKRNRSLIQEVARETR